METVELLEVSVAGLTINGNGIDSFIREITSVRDGKIYWVIKLLFEFGEAYNQSAQIRFKYKSQVFDLIGLVTKVSGSKIDDSKNFIEISVLKPELSS